MYFYLSLFIPLKRFLRHVCDYVTPLGGQDGTDGDILFNEILVWALPIRTTTQKL